MRIAEPPAYRALMPASLRFLRIKGWLARAGLARAEVVKGTYRTVRTELV